MDLHIVWFGMLGILLAGYAVLDGFDLGVGILHPLAKSDEERRTFVNAIGPLWDGNEVWLVTFGGALFAMFPEAYATVFSGFYTAFMLLLFALILRAVSLEFRGKLASPRWRGTWDAAFFAGSLAAPLLFGVAVGNAILGLPLSERGVYAGGLVPLLGPYPLLVGTLSASLFAMHGAIFLYLKTEGAVQERLGRWMWHTWGLFLVLYLLTTMWTLAAVPTALRNFERFPWAVGVVVLSVLSIANVPRALFHGRYGEAFLSTVATIATLVFVFGLAIYPNLVVAKGGPGASLTIYNAASSPATLRIGLIIAGIGMPFVLAYTGVVYWTFRGKVVLGEHSY